MLGRRQSWPAVLLLGLGLLTLALTLKSGQADWPVQPLWFMAVPAGLYVLLGLAMAGLNWRWPVAAVVMAAGQAFLALLMGWGYSALEGQPRDPYSALVHGLWDYLPGSVLQVGFAVPLGVVVTAWLRREPQGPCYVLAAATETECVCLPDLEGLEPAAVVSRVAEVPEVGAALAARGGALWGAGAWARDPEAARQRALLLSRRTGSGLNTFDLGETVLVIRSEEDRCAALLATQRLPTTLVHDLLRGLWALVEAPAEAVEH